MFSAGCVTTNTLRKRNQATPVYPAGLWSRSSWGQHQATGAHPGAYGWERVAGEGRERKLRAELQLLLRKALRTSTPPSTTSSS